MADESRPPFVLPDSVLRRRRGLLAGAMTNPPPHQWAEHLELLSAEGRLTSVEDMLALMRSELDRLQEQINPDDEPDRHAETVLAAATASVLDDRRLPVLRFSIILGYLYGRLTKPGKKSQEEVAAYSRLARELLHRESRRQRGPQSLEEQRENGRSWMRGEADKLWKQDHAKVLRIGEAVEIVRSKVGVEVQKRKDQGDEQPWKHWPKGADAIRKIIREVAPDYATKPGAPRRI